MIGVPNTSWLELIGLVDKSGNERRAFNCEDSQNKFWANDVAIVRTCSAYEAPFTFVYLVILERKTGLEVAGTSSELPDNPAYHLLLKKYHAATPTPAHPSTRFATFLTTTLSKPSTKLL